MCDSIIRQVSSLPDPSVFGFGYSLNQWQALYMQAEGLGVWMLPSLLATRLKNKPWGKYVSSPPLSHSCAVRIPTFRHAHRDQPTQNAMDRSHPGRTALGKSQESTCPEHKGQTSPWENHCVDHGISPAARCSCLEPLLLPFGCLQFRLPQKSQ